MKWWYEQFVEVWVWGEAGLAEMRQSQELRAAAKAALVG